MTSTFKILAGMALCGAVALTGCKKKEEAPAAPAANTAANTAAQAPSAQPQSTPAPAAAPAVKPFDPASVPLSTATLPPFPLVDRPPGASGFHSDEKAFDRVYVIAGDELRPVEGRVSERWFPPHALKMSLLEAYRNYDNALKALGAVPVSAAHPTDPAFIARNGGDKAAILKKLRVPNIEKSVPSDVPTYVTYLLRAPEKNYWISYFVFDGENNVSLVVVEEKAMAQTVGYIKADEMKSALDREGHVALYVNFDTDSDRIRPDSTAVIDEIAKLLRGDDKLRLSVEGHTDSSGDAKHNRDLSLQRAQSVVRAVTARQIDGKRLSAVGHGADKPLADNGTEEGKAKNRRVELVKA